MAFLNFSAYAGSLLKHWEEGVPLILQKTSLHLFAGPLFSLPFWGVGRWVKSDL